MSRRPSRSSPSRMFPDRPQPTPQSYGDIAEIVGHLPRSQLLWLAKRSLAIAEEREGNPGDAIGNRNCIVTAAVCCSLIVERGPELVA